VNGPRNETSRIVAVVQYRAMGKLGRGCLLCLVVTERMSHAWIRSVLTILIIRLL